MILACHANQMLLICYSFWILEFLEGFCSVQYFQDFAIYYVCVSLYCIFSTSPLSSYVI